MKSLNADFQGFLRGHAFTFGNLHSDTYWALGPCESFVFSTQSWFRKSLGGLMDIWPCPKYV